MLLSHLLRSTLLAALAAGCSLLAQSPSDEEVLALSRKSLSAPLFRQTVEGRFNPEQRTNGMAHFSHGPEFLFVFESTKPPKLSIDDTAPAAMKKASGDLWTYATRLAVGRSHALQYSVDGQAVGRRYDVPAYTPDHYPQPGVPQGSVSEKIVHMSKIYPGMQSDYWVYLAPGLDAATPAPVMIWQDGQGLASRDSRSHLFYVIENLVHQKKIPPMVHVLIAPGMVGEKRMRSIEYDTVNDRYARFLLDEILPEVEKRQKLRTDGYSRAIGGGSSGGICSFNAAWQLPDQFSRVFSRIGSYTSIQWIRGQANPADDLDGGNIFPFLVRKSPRKNIRVWMEDGSNDLENFHGSWPLQNIQLANSLKMKEYDFHFTFGNAQHSPANGDSHLPEALAWLWRGYDLSKTSEVYVMDSAEKDKPYFRVQSLNRTE